MFTLKGCILAFLGGVIFFFLVLSSRWWILVAVICCIIYLYLKARHPGFFSRKKK